MWGGGVHVHAQGGQRLVLGIFLYHSPPYFFKQYLLLSLELIHLSRQAGQLDLRIYLSLLFPIVLCLAMCFGVPGFTWVLGIRIQVVMLVWQALNWQATFLAHGIQFLYLFCVLHIYMHRQGRFFFNFYFLWRVRTFWKIIRHWHLELMGNKVSLLSCLCAWPSKSWAWSWSAGLSLGTLCCILWSLLLCPLLVFDSCYVLRSFSDALDVAAQNSDLLCIPGSSL